MIPGNKKDNNIPARWMTHGIIVQGSEDSGWKITGKSTGFLEEKCYQLVQFTSAGQVSENWAEIFQDGYGYFGIKENDAVFAHFYRSDVPSARGRYFVPRSILLIPYTQYIHELQCDPVIVFEELKKHKPTSAGPIDKVIQLAPIQIPPKTGPEIPFQLAQLKNIDEKPLIDFLTCILQPQSPGTIIWGGEKPDSEFLFSLLLLLPRTLRQLITFCTCVESPLDVGVRVKIVKDLALYHEDSSLIIIKDKKIDIREKRIHRQTLLPEILVKEFKKEIEALNKLHREIDTKTALLQETDLEKALKLTERMIDHIGLKRQIDAIPDAQTKYQALIDGVTGFKTDPQDREFMLEQIQKGMREIKPNERAAIQKQLAQLLQELDPIRPAEVEGLTKIFRQSIEIASTPGQLPLLKLYISIPVLKEAITSVLFEKLTLEKTPGWEQAFEILALIQNKTQLDQLEKNAPLLTQLKQHKEAELFFVLLELIVTGKEPPWELLESYDDKIQGHRISDILNHGFNYFENFKEERQRLLFFLMMAACMYRYIQELPQKQQKELFETSFTNAFSRAIFFKAGEKAGNIIDGIHRKIESINPGFAKRLEAVLNRRKLIEHMAGLTKVMNREGVLSFAGSEDAAVFFRLLDSRDHQAEQSLNLVSLFFEIALHFRVIPAAILLPAYIKYLQEKQHPTGEDVQILMAALTKDPSPLEKSSFFRKVYKMVLTRTQGESLTRNLHILFILAKKFIRENPQGIQNEIDRDVVKKMEENWQPQGIEEVREIYQAVSSCFDIIVVQRILGIGLSRCIKSESGKQKVLDLVKDVRLLAAMAGSDDPFEMLLNNIKDSINQNPAIASGDFLTAVNKKYEGYKSMIEKLEPHRKRRK